METIFSERPSENYQSTILIVDDDEINRGILDNLFSSDYVVEEAENGKVGLQKILSDPEAYSAVLLDVMMPKMDGCEASRRIRALRRPDAGTVPILAVTANAFAEDITATAAAGMNAHVSKPIDFTLLCKQLEKWINKA